MDITSRLSISYYKEIAVISEPHKIFVVRHIETGRIFVKKIIDVYNKRIYDHLRSHPIMHTPKIYEVCEYDNSLIVIEEYISGDTLEQLLEHGFNPDSAMIDKIIVRLCEIVKNLHSCDPAIIHRDIKPSNIIINPSGDLYLLDFNAAKYYSDDKEEDTSLLGTKGYAAPEQYGFGVSTQQTDIYAVGILLRTLKDSSSLLTHAQADRYAAIIARCIKLEPRERFLNVDSLLIALRSNTECLPAEKKAIPKWATYLPPGFRHLSPISMILSGLGYFVILDVSMSLKVESVSVFDIYTERFFCLLMILAVIFCTANYLNIHAHFPLCSSRNILLKILGIIALDIIAVFGLGIAMCAVLAL